MSGYSLLECPCESVHPWSAELVCAGRVGHGGRHAHAGRTWPSGPLRAPESAANGKACPDVDRRQPPTGTYSGPTTRWSDRPVGRHWPAV